MEFSKERKYVGAIDQLFSVKEYTLCGGRKEGVHAIDICTGAGLEVTLLPDRFMDIYQVKYKGKGLNYLTQTGISGPQFFDEFGAGWAANFPGGFLSTCGMKNIGLGGEDCYGSCALHGTAGNIPADHVNIFYDTEDDVPCVKISGVMWEASLFGTCLTLMRTYKFQYGSNTFTIVDHIENTGCRPSPFMMLYHFNMGYPLLAEDSELIIPTRKVTPRTPHAAAFVEAYKTITAPANNYEEMCYYHDLETDENGFSTVGIQNRRQGLGVKITFDKTKLDHFVQWKMLGTGEYVTGLEPCNATIDGRKDAEENGSLKMIFPGQIIEYPLKIEVFG